MKLLKETKTLGSLLMLSLLLVSGFAFAQASDFGTLAENVHGTFGSIGDLMIIASYIAGFALTIAAIFKFKQHKDNPTQIPVGTPIALLVIGVILVFLPALLSSSGETIYGGEQTVGGYEAQGERGLSGGTGGGQ